PAGAQIGLCTRVNNAIYFAWLVKTCASGQQSDKFAKQCLGVRICREKERRFARSRLRSLHRFRARRFPAHLLATRESPRPPASVFLRLPPSLATSPI